MCDVIKIYMSKKEMREEKWERKHLKRDEFGRIYDVTQDTFRIFLETALPLPYLLVI